MSQQLLRRVDSSVDARYGRKPEERSLSEALSAGIVIIDKPMGPTSHQVAAWVRDMLSIEKTGHGGTLDPRVTGVLPVGLGNAVRAMDYIHVSGKKYIGLMRLHGDVEASSVESTFKEFLGEIFQLPPVRSAVKRAVRTRRIHSLDILEKSGREVLFEVSCEGGTYIRTLCVDMGDALGVGAHLQDLRRTSAGPFKEDDAVTLHHLKDAIEYSKEGDYVELMKAIKPVESVFLGWKTVIIKDSAVGAVCHGAPVAIPGLTSLSKDIRRDEKVAIFTLKGEIIATGVARMTSEEMMTSKDGLALELERVFMEPAIYPKIWSSRERQ